MLNILDYIMWRGDLSFSMRPFNEIDNAVFSLLAYYCFDGIVADNFKKPHLTFQAAVKTIEQRSPQGISEYFENDKSALLLKVLSESLRYKNVRMVYYVNKIDTEKQLQFSAITFLPPASKPFIAFRGTGSSITGWKEDFNMALSNEVPAQREACLYLEYAASHIIGRFYVGGHSKGGNLAIYAAASCQKKIQRRIINIYSNDGPGFNNEFITSDSYKKIKPKVRALLPEGSIIGQLFEHDYDTSFIVSSESGLKQHNIYTWGLCRDTFTRTHCQAGGTAILNKSIMEWINNMDKQHREEFIESLYKILTETDIKSTHEMRDAPLDTVQRIFKTFLSSDKNTKHMLLQTARALVSRIAHNSMHNWGRGEGITHDSL